MPHRPWKLEMNTFSADAPWTAAMRVRISSRALFVNVRQRIDAGSNPFRMSRPVRSVRVFVFPEPGPARVRIRPCTWLATSSCCALSCMGGAEDTNRFRLSQRRQFGTLPNTSATAGRCVQSWRMCGRYTLVRLADLSDLFPWVTDDVPDAPPRYNIAPTQPVLAVANDKPD